MTSLKYNQIITCPHCGQETPNYEDCILCGYSFQDPRAPLREIAEDDIQKMMMDAKLQELQAKRAILLNDSWDRAPWLDRLNILTKIAPRHAKVHYYIGLAHIEMGQYRQAIVSLTRALSLDPTLADAIRLRGDCQNTLVPVLSGDVQVYYDRAMADYQAALELQPDAYTYNAHAAIISSLGQWDQAIEEYDRAIALTPNYPETFFNRGYLFKMQGENERAIADFQKFLSFPSHWNMEMVSQAQNHIKDMTETT